MAVAVLEICNIVYNLNNNGHYSIGNGIHCTIHIKDDTVDSLHASLVIKDKIYLTDYNSKNGTYCNKELLEKLKVIEITKSCNIKFGKVLATLQLVPELTSELLDENTLDEAGASSTSFSTTKSFTSTPKNCKNNSPKMNEAKICLKLRNSISPTILSNINYSFCIPETQFPETDYSLDSNGRNKKLFEEGKDECIIDLPTQDEYYVPETQEYFSEKRKHIETNGENKIENEIDDLQISTLQFNKICQSSPNVYHDNETESRDLFEHLMCTESLTKDNVGSIALNKETIDDEISQINWKDIKIDNHSNSTTPDILNDSPKMNEAKIRLKLKKSISPTIPSNIDYSFCVPETEEGEDECRIDLTKQDEYYVPETETQQYFSEKRKHIETNGKNKIENEIDDLQINTIQFNKICQSSPNVYNSDNETESRGLFDNMMWTESLTKNNVGSVALNKETNDDEISQINWRDIQIDNHSNSTTPDIFEISNDTSRSLNIPVLTVAPPNTMLPISSSLSNISTDCDKITKRMENEKCLESISIISINNNEKYSDDSEFPLTQEFLPGCSKIRKKKLSKLETEREKNVSINSDCVAVQPFLVKGLSQTQVFKVTDRSNKQTKLLNMAETETPLKPLGICCYNMFNSSESVSESSSNEVYSTEDRFANEIKNGNIKKNIVSKKNVKTENNSSDGDLGDINFDCSLSLDFLKTPNTDLIKRTEFDKQEMHVNVPVRTLLSRSQTNIAIKNVSCGIKKIRKRSSLSLSSLSKTKLELPLNAKKKEDIVTISSKENVDKIPLKRSKRIENRKKKLQCNQVI